MHASFLLQVYYGFDTKHIDLLHHPSPHELLGGVSFGHQVSPAER